MRKIFRMALVFALTGATLMYTGCTKDYSEEINGLGSDVASLNTNLQALQQDLSTLKSSVSALESAYNAAAEAIKKSIDAYASAIAINADAIKVLQGKVTAAEDAIKKLEAAAATHATKDDLNSAVKDLQDQLASLKAEITGKIDALQADVNTLKEKLTADEETIAANKEAIKALEEAQAKINEAITALSNELRSLVFVPDFYLDGIEASAYDFTSVEPIESYWGYKNEKGEKINFSESVKINGKNVKVVFPVDSKIEWRYIVERDAQGKEVTYNEKGKKDPTGEYYNYYKEYTLGQKGKLAFDLNPSSFDVEDAQWSIKGMDRPYITRAEDATEWTPEFIGVQNIDGQAIVEYRITNPEALFSSTSDTYMNIKGFEGQLKRYEDGKRRTNPVEYNNIPVIQAQAALEDGKTVSSDWAAIANGEEWLDHLAFASDNKYKADETYCDISKVKDLYTNPLEAIKAKNVVPVQYNGGAVDLSKLINIHEWINHVGDNELNVEELAAKYPGFKYEFELLPFTIGENYTSENMYGNLTKEGMFTPCYVKIEGGETESVIIEKGSEEKLGISAVGRTPIVLVTLVEPKGDVVLYGYFKIQIVKNADTREVNIPSFGKLPFVCRPVEEKTTWAEFSYLVLEKLGIDYNQFAAQYTDEEIWAYEMVKVRDNVEEEQFKKIGEVRANRDVYSADTKYGKTTYTIDKTGTGVNNAFTWDVYTKAIGAGKTKTIYHKFVNNIDPLDIVYVALTAEVAEAAKFDFGGNKIANEWFDDLHVWAIDDAENNTAHMNTLVPEADNTDANPVYTSAKGGNVLKYVRNLNHYYQNYTPGKVLSADADPIYEEVLKDNSLKDLLNASAEFSFASEQPAIKGVQLFTNEYESIGECSMFKVLYAGKYVNGVLKTQNITVDGKTVKVAEYDEDNLIAIIDGDVISYQNTLTAEKFLNYWSHKETAEDKILYANIHVDVTYGKCKIDAGDADFHIRFIRPLDITLEGQKISKDGVVDGANVYLAQFLSGIVDWNAVNVVKVATNAQTGKKISSNVVSNIDMFKFYQFKNIKVDLSKTKVNGWKEGALDEFGFAYNQPGANGAKGIKPDMKLSIGKIEGGEFKEASEDLFNAQVFKYDLTKAGNSVEVFNTYVINYRNEAARVDAFDMQIPISFEYAWGSYEGTLEIHVDATN